MLTRRNFLLRASATLCAAGPCGQAASGGNGPLTIVVGEFAPAVEHYAAQELQRFVRTLYKFDPIISTCQALSSTGATILLGSPKTNPHVARLAGKVDWDSVTSDGFFLKTIKTK